MNRPLEEILLSNVIEPVERGDTLKMDIALALARELRKLRKELKPKDDKIIRLEKENKDLREKRLKLQITLFDIEKRWKNALQAPRKLRLRLGNANRRIKKLELELGITTPTKY